MQIGLSPKGNWKFEGMKNAEVSAQKQDTPLNEGFQTDMGSHGSSWGKKGLSERAQIIHVFHADILP